MPRALDPYVSRVPDLKELSAVSAPELQRIVGECREIEAATAAEIAETLEWARNVRTVAERALTKRRA